MAELVFYTGPMNSGKSTLALQVEHTHASGGRHGRLFTRADRSDMAIITSRIGLERIAVDVSDDFDFWQYVVRSLTTGQRIDFLVCDEAQFYSPTQIDQLARVVDELQIDVFAFGILTDFRSELFPGSRRLIELADHVAAPQVRPLCWCGKPGTHNARTVNGSMVTQGDQVVVGDVEGTQTVRYEVLCRQHHRRRLTSAVATTILNPEPLPFE